MIKLSLKMHKIMEEETTAKHQVIGFISDNITNIFSLFNFASRNREHKNIKHFMDKNATKKDYDGNMLYTIFQSIGGFLYVSILIIILFYSKSIKLFFF